MMNRFPRSFAKRSQLTVLALSLAAFSALADSAPVLREDSTAFWLPYVPGTNTLALYSFDGADPLADLSAKSAALAVAAGVTVVPDGRLGHGLHFAPGHAKQTLTLGDGLFAAGRFICELWVKADALPPTGTSACLLDKNQVPDKANGIRLAIEADGSIIWRHRTLSSNPKAHPEWFVELRSPTGTVVPGTWHHVAVHVGRFSPEPGAPIAYLAIDGTEVARAANGWMYIDYTRKEEGPSVLVLGSDTKGGSAFAGTIDQLRIVTGLYRHFSPVPDESWLDPEKKRPLPADPDCVAQDADILFKASFDGSVDADSAKGNPKPVRLAGTPTFEPGVRGQALCSFEGKWLPLCYAGKDNVNPTMGATEFWLKPVGWQTTDTRQVFLFGVENGGPTMFVPNDAFSIQISGGRENYEVAFQDGKWMHLVLVWAGRQITLYVNGEKKIESLLAAPFDPARSYGMFNVPFHQQKRMLVDEFSIYRRPLSPTEVMNHYRRYFPNQPLTKIGAADASLAFLQGVGTVCGMVYLRQLPTEIPAALQFSVLQNGQAALGLLNAVKSLATIRLPCSAAGAAAIEMSGLPVPMPPGDFAMRIESVDAAGKKRLVSEQPFRFKRYPWLGNTVGVSDRVLKPWTPIVAKGNSLDVVGRTYTVGRNGFFSQIRNQGQEMLKAPMALEYEAGGKSAAVDGKLKFGETKPNAVEWRSEASEKIGDGTLQVVTTARLEYDGHVLFKIRLAPGKGPVKLDRLSLVLPLREEFVKLYLCVFDVAPPQGMGVIPAYGEFSPTDPTLFSSKAWYEYTGWDGETQHTGVFNIQQAQLIQEKKNEKLKKRWKPTVGNFMPQIWLGTDEVGLAFMADNDAGWVPTDEFPAMTLERRDGAVEWRFNFVSAPFEFTAPREITLSFQATPEKPQPPNWRRHFWRGEKVPAPAGSLTAKWIGYGMDEEGSYEGAPYNPDGNRKAVEAAHAEGIKATTHLDTSWMNWGQHTAEEFGAEWDPCGNIQYNQIFTRSKVDYFVWSMDQWRQKYGIDGVYFDTGTPKPNFNTISGTAYRLPDGRTQPGWALFGQRECYKRCAYVFGDVGTEGFNWSCGYTGPQIAGWQWAAVPGGEYRIDYAMDRYPGPFTFMRTLSNGGHFGTMMMWMGLSEYVKFNEAPENAARFYRHMYAMMLPLDAKWSFCSFNYPPCFYEFGYADADVRFIGFWDNPYVTCTPAAADLLPSLYLKPNGRALLVVTNLGDDARNVALRFDAKGMGLDPAKARILDGERDMLKDEPAGTKRNWHRFINRGGAAIMPGGDEALRKIETSATADALGASLLIPPRDYRLLELLPE